MKWYSKVFIALGVIFGSILCFCGVVILNGTCFSSFKCETEEGKDWMKNLLDDQLLTSVKIPGSHDACTYDMVWLGECQNFDIEKQLDCGVRYFDIRVNKTDDKYVIYHGPINGVEFDPILDSIASFISVSPTETLILDFQHFDNGAQDYVYEKVTEKLLSYAVINNTDKSDLEYVSELKVKDVRGKCLILFGYGAYENEAHIFRRNNDDCSNSGCSLDSFYYTERNTADSKTYIEEHIPFYINAIKEKHAQESYKGLSVLQCQLTDGALIFGPYSKEKTHDRSMSNYINDLHASQDFEDINIIMRDFMDDRKAKEIYILNFIK